MVLSYTNAIASDDFVIFRKDEWTTKDNIYESTFAGLVAVDMLTTLDLKNHPNLEETNVILGKHPSDIQVITWSIAGTILHYGIATLLSENARRAWQVGGIAMEVSCIGNNVSLGAHMAF